MLGLSDDSGEPTLPQPVFHQRQEFGVVAGFSVQHALGIQPDLIKRRREQIARAHNPQDRPAGTRRDRGDEQGGGRIVAPPGAFPGHFMQRVSPEPQIGKPRVDFGNPERQDRAGAIASLVNPERLSQLGNDKAVG